MDAEDIIPQSLEAIAKAWVRWTAGRGTKLGTFVATGIEYATRKIERAPTASGRFDLARQSVTDDRTDVDERLDDYFFAKSA